MQPRAAKMNNVRYLLKVLSWFDRVKFATVVYEYFVLILAVFWLFCVTVCDITLVL